MAGGERRAKLLRWVSDDLGEYAPCLILLTAAFLGARIYHHRDQPPRDVPGA